MNPLVTVIVPVYKVEAYLDRCVESIVSQTYQNLEILLVDDGSPDRCPEMCDAWSRKDARISVIHQQNCGLSGARNAGVAQAKGSCICFVDSDDWISPDYVETLWGLLADRPASIAVCGFHRVSQDGIVHDSAVRAPEAVELLDSMEAIRRIYFNDAFCVAWGCMIPADIVKQYPFPAGQIHEDEAVKYKYYAAAEHVVYTPRRLYFYFIREGSIMQGKVDTRKTVLLSTLLQRIRFLEDHAMEALVPITVKRLCDLTLWLETELEDAALCKKIHSQAVQVWRRYGALFDIEESGYLYKAFSPAPVYYGKKLIHRIFQGEKKHGRHGKN